MPWMSFDPVSWAIRSTVKNNNNMMMMVIERKDITNRSCDGRSNSRPSLLELALRAVHEKRKQANKLLPKYTIIKLVPEIHGFVDRTALLPAIHPLLLVRQTGSDELTEQTSKVVFDIVDALAVFN